MKEQGYPPPGNRSFFIILDGITVIALVLELWSIGSGLIRCFQWGDFKWYPLCSTIMMILLIGFGPFSLALWCLFIGANIYSLYHKAAFYLHHTRVYQRTNALLIQILFLICTAITLIAMLDYSRF